MDIDADLAVVWLLCSLGLAEHCSGALRHWRTQLVAVYPVAVAWVGSVWCADQIDYLRR